MVDDPYPFVHAKINQAFYFPMIRLEPKPDSYKLLPVKDGFVPEWIQVGDGYLWGYPDENHIGTHELKIMIETGDKLDHLQQIKLIVIHPSSSSQITQSQHE
jgi:hypothetical protein